MTDYTDLLNKSWDEVPKAQILPVGWYVLDGRGGKLVAGDENRSSKVLFFYGVVEPTDDVDEDALAELGDDYDVSINRLTAQLWFEEQGDIDKVRSWLEAHGTDMSGTIADTIKEGTKNVRVLGYIDHRAYEDSASGEMKTAMDLKNIRPLED